jgi:hypothetical protein
MHEYVELFPLMLDDELRELADDIKANGQRDPIVLFDGQILDGRHRYLACGLAGVAPEFTTFEGTEADALALVVSRNVHRRHLTAAQRAISAAYLVTVKHGGDRRSDQAATLPVDAPTHVTQAQAAAMVKVSERTVRDAVAVRAASPKLAEQVRAGKISLSKAAAQVRARTGPRKAPTARRRPVKRDVEKQLEQASVLLGVLTLGRLMPAQRARLRMLLEAAFKRLDDRPGAARTDEAPQPRGGGLATAERR